MKTLAITLMLALCGSAQADDLELTLGGWSKHLGSPGRYADYVNETHNTVGIRYKWAEISTFENSHRHRSWSASAIYRYKLNDSFELGIRGGAITGYEGYTLTAVIHPHVTAFYKSVGVELGWIPDISKWHEYGVATITGKFRF